ncbi:C-type lectin domain family 4 member K-like isoform X5 [Sceloporus undulatus]|uniref:C-type lectin domain family 4 member K-like isoform X5 n=1 Tax=Sceloporus undulatus TaxID=8520 RepID=UPI001C4BBB0A|nr:C-type lectin domain family 4 member K-like isoform X5 [Sceloporus undulatus]
MAPKPKGKDAKAPDAKGGKPDAKDAGKDAGKDDGKGKPGEPEEEEYVDFSQFNPFTRIPAKKIWIGCGIFAVIWLIIMSLAIYAYYTIKGMGKLPIEEPFKMLRRTMAVGFRNPNVAYDHYDKVAAQVKDIPDYVKTSEKDYEDMKKKYHQKSWYDAENFCLSRDSHLASILTSDEQNYIVSQFSEPFWIGLTDENIEGEWEWSDGSRVIMEDWSVSKQNFSKGDDSMEKDCVFIETSFGQLEYSWKDADCHELKRWACKETITMDNHKFEQIYFMK